MIKKLILAVVFISVVLELKAQTTCNPNGNVVLFSNYDGGVLNINVDVNIPNLKIGVVSYEMVTINLTGPFVNNVTAVQFAGYTTTTHQHCTNTPPVTSIVGAPPGTDTLVFMPASPVSNPNGYSLIICNYSCDTTSSQGGCNTPDQVAAYFQQVFGGLLRFHYTQYGCWNGPYDLSAGGNCCVGAIAASGAPISALQSSDTSFCDKKCIDFTDLSTNNPTSWHWLFPGADTTSSSLQNPTNICYNTYGSFDVTLIACNANGCDTMLLPGFINSYQPPAVPVITSGHDTLYSSPAFAFQWYHNASPIAGATGSFYVVQQQGGYYVIVTDSNGCASSSNAVYTGIAEMSGGENDVLVIPNPTPGPFDISYTGTVRGYISAEVYDVTGRQLMNSNLINTSNGIHIKLNNPERGIYLLKIFNGKTVLNKKLVVDY